MNYDSKPYKSFHNLILESARIVNNKFIQLMLLNLSFYSKLLKTFRKFSKPYKSSKIRVKHPFKFQKLYDSKHVSVISQVYNKLQAHNKLFSSTRSKIDELYLKKHSIDMGTRWRSLNSSEKRLFHYHSRDIWEY